MLEIRRDEDIHREEGGWFSARWHFSFDHYRDPQQMGVGALRVFNDDRLVPGGVWPLHPHRDVESLTYVVEGTFAHEDSLGNGGVLHPGAAQVMSFDSRGALHSERNGSETEPMRFIQFWILPSERASGSSVQQHQFTAEERTDRWLTIMSPAGQDGLDLLQDARVSVSRLTSGNDIDHVFAADRAGYLYLMDGAATLNGEKVGTGDAAKIEHGPETLELTAAEDAELILIDVPHEFEPVGVWAAR
jgi:redox-sensitive bicupin YhaK (pirin superfamily)